MRNAARDLAGGRRGAAPDATSVALVAQLAGSVTGPGTAAARAEDAEEASAGRETRELVATG